MSTLSRVAEVTLSYHPSRALHPVAKDSATTAEIIRNDWDEDTLEYKESMKVMLLNNANRILGISKVGDGGIACCPADIRIIMQAALVGNATSIILTHNHPSGSLSASKADKELTRKVSEACRIMDIRLVDHIIITGTDYYSFNDNGLL